MICTVDLNFAFVGGSSLQGPISKLQNAVTYNFFANTQIYEPASNYVGVRSVNAETNEYNPTSAIVGRSDTITVGEGDSAITVINSGTIGGGDYYPGSNIRQTYNPATPINPSPINRPDNDQLSELELVQANTAPPIQPTTGATADLARISVSSVEIKDGTNFDTGETGIYVDITFTFEGVNADDSSTHLSDAYQLGEVLLIPKNSNQQYDAILFENEISLDGDTPTQIIRNQVFFSDDKLKPVTDNTSNPTYIDLTDAEVIVVLGELVKMERGKGEFKEIKGNVTLNKSDKYGLPIQA
jgi:hypothetical protein